MVFEKDKLLATSASNFILLGSLLIVKILNLVLFFLPLGFYNIILQNSVKPNKVNDLIPLLRTDESTYIRIGDNLAIVCLDGTVGKVSQRKRNFWLKVNGKKYFTHLQIIFYILSILSCSLYVVKTFL